MFAIKPNLKLRKEIIRLLTGLVVLYLLLCFAGCALQRRLIYFPTKLDPQAAEQLAAKEGFEPWRNQAGAIIGWKVRASVQATGSVLIVHGNAGCALHRGYLAKPIHATGGRDVYVLEYPGYGPRAGSPGMKSFLAAGEEALARLPNHVPIHVVSESLGAGVAAHLARVHGDRVAGLMMLAPYNNLVAVGRRQMPFLPISLILRDRFDPAAWLEDYGGPVSILVAGADEVIPADLGRKLYHGYAGPKHLQVIEGAGHNDVSEQSTDWWRNAFAFWEENSRSRR